MTQPLAFDRATGAPVDEAEATAAVAEGRAAFQRGTEVWTRAPDGGYVTFPAENAAKAVAEGYVIAPRADVDAYVKERELRKEAGSLGGMAKAGAEGLARGATFGLSDQLLTGAGVDPEQMRARQEANPILSTASEITGAIAPALLSGGAGAVGTAARLAPTAALARGTAAVGSRVAGRLGGGALARVAGSATAAGLEGAAYGAGQVISQAALTDTELTAERILAGAGEGALFGAALGGGASGLGALLGGAGRKLGATTSGQNLSTRLRNLSNEQFAVEVLGKSGTKAVMRRGGEERLRRIGQRVRESGLADDASAAVTAVRAELDEGVAKMGELSRGIKETLDAESLRTRLAKQLDEIAPPGKVTTGTANKASAAVRAEVEPLLAQLDDAARSGEGITFERAWQLRKELDDSDLMKWDRTTGPKMETVEMRKVRGLLNEAMDEHLKKASPEQAAAWKKLNQEVSDGIELAKQLDASVANEATEQVTTAGDRVMGGALGLGWGIAQGGDPMSLLQGAAMGAVGSAASKYVRSNQRVWLAKAADRLSRATERTDYAARRLAGQRAVPPPARLAVPVALPIKQRFEAAQADIEALNANQAQMRARLESLTGELSQTHPDVAAAMHARFIGDTQHLASKRPGLATTNVANSLTPAANKARVSRVEMASFMSRVDALSDPTSVLEDAAEGKVNLDAIETLRERRPAIYRDLRERVIRYAAQRGEAIPYKQRVALSVAFEFAADPSLTPQGMADIQASFVPSESTEQKQPGKLESSSPEAGVLPSQKAQES